MFDVYCDLWLNNNRFFLVTEYASQILISSPPHDLIPSNFSCFHSVPICTLTFLGRICVLFHSRWTPGISGYFAERTYKPPLSLNSANKFHENPTKSPYPRASKDFQNNFREESKFLKLNISSCVCQRFF